MLICMQIITKTYNFKCLQDMQLIQELYYSITKSQVKWVIVWCAIYALQAANKGKLLIKLIRVKFYLKQLVINLIDF